MEGNISTEENNEEDNIYVCVLYNVIREKIELGENIINKSLNAD